MTDIIRNTGYNLSDLDNVHTVELYLGRCRRWRLHDLGESRGQCHLITEVHMSFLQELRHFGSSRMYAGKDGEDGFLARKDLLVKHIVCLIKLNQSWGTKNHKDGIDLIEALFTVIDGNAKFFSCSRGKDVDGVGNR